jgi:hypothetical protein
VFFGGQIIWKIVILTHRKEFCGQIFFKIKIARFLQQILASSQNIRGLFLKIILSIAKFG